MAAQPAGATRRVGSTSSQTRDLLLDIVQRLMVGGGYASVSYRSVAAGADVAPSLVQYYFPKLDDLFIALLRRGTTQACAHLAAAGEAEQPLRAVWRYAQDAMGAALVMEFLALGRNRPSIGDEIGIGGELVRRAQVAAISARWDDYGDAVRPFTPESLVFAMGAVARMVVLERTFGMRTGHDETTRAVEALLDRVEPRRHQPARRATSRRGPRGSTGEVPS